MNPAPKTVMGIFCGFGPQKKGHHHGNPGRGTSSVPVSMQQSTGNTVGNTSAKGKRQKIPKDLQSSVGNLGPIPGVTRRIYSGGVCVFSV